MCAEHFLHQTITTSPVYFEGDFEQANASGFDSLLLDGTFMGYERCRTYLFPRHLSLVLAIIPRVFRCNVERRGNLKFTRKARAITISYGLLSDACGENGPEKSSSFDLAMNCGLIPMIQKFVRKLRLGKFQGLNLIQLGSTVSALRKTISFSLAVPNLFFFLISTMYGTTSNPHILNAC